MTTRNLDAVFAPKSIALIGASDRPGTVGAVVARNLLTAGFAGRIFLVNQRAQTVEGRAVYTSVASLPEAPDLAIIATPPQTAPSLVAELGARGCHAAVVVSAGFGSHDAPLRQALLDAARPHLLRVVGPNCLGVQSPRSHVNASFAHVEPAAGKIALVSQSGAILASLLDWAAARAIGFSRVVSLGDMSDVDFGDMLDFLALDAETKAVLLYIENVTHAHKFISAGRIAARGKPVIVVKSGRSQAGARAAATHTGALAGADLVYDAAFRRAGMLRVDDLGDLFDAAAMLASGPRVKGDRLTILTNGGGAGVLAADELEARGGRLAPLSTLALEKLNAVLPPTWSHANPIDIIGDAGEERYLAAMRILLADNAQDALLVMNCPTGVADSLASASAIADLARETSTPVLTCWLGEATARNSRALFEARAVPSFETPDQAVRALMQLVTYRRNQDQLLQTPCVLPHTSDRAAARRVIEQAMRQGRLVLTEAEAKDVLKAYNLPVVETWIAHTASDAAARATKVGGRVVLKIYSPGISHKSDVGGVALNLQADAVEREAAAMLERVGPRAPGARLLGFTVQRMVETSGATELLAGLHVDPTFGAVVLFGAGGVAVEVNPDRAMAIAPINAALAGDLIDRTHVAKLLLGYRNVPPANRAAIEAALVALSDLAVENPEIESLDINPLLANASGIVALDARISLRYAPAHSDLSITPYPASLERTRTIAGATISFRPIRPEDEHALIAMAAHCDAEDLRFRFHGAVTALTHAMAARLTQMDYDREMAIIALDGEAIVGVVHILYDPNFENGEFAILVRTDRQGEGLGGALMSMILDNARAKGCRSVAGNALRQNTQIVALTKALGATIVQSPAADGVVTLQFSLE